VNDEIDFFLEKKRELAVKGGSFFCTLWVEGWICFFISCLVFFVYFFFFSSDGVSYSI